MSTVKSLQPTNRGHEKSAEVTANKFNAVRNNIDDYDLAIVRGNDEIPVHKAESVRKYQKYFSAGYVLRIKKREAVPKKSLMVGPRE